MTCARLRRACERAAAASGWQAPLVLSTTPDDAGSGLTRRALEVGADLVIAAGGDGTVRACAEVLAGTGVPLAIVPAGSANLTATALGLPSRAEAALRVAFGGRDRQIDLARRRRHDVRRDGGHRARRRRSRRDPERGEATGRLVGVRGGGGQSAAAARRPRSPIRLDGGQPMIRRARSVTVGNSGALPGGFQIMPAARLDDGLLDVVVLAPAGLLGWASVGYRVLVRSRRDDSQLERYRAAAVEIHADADLPRQVDGEIIAPAPVADRDGAAGRAAGPGPPLAAGLRRGPTLKSRPHQDSPADGPASAGDQSGSLISNPTPAPQALR